MSTCQQHCNPDMFCFMKNSKGEVEMVYRLLAGGDTKQWLTKEKPFDRTSTWLSFTVKTRKQKKSEKMEKISWAFQCTFDGCRNRMVKSFYCLRENKGEAWEEIPEKLESHSILAPCASNTLKSKMKKRTKTYSELKKTYWNVWTRNTNQQVYSFKETLLVRVSGMNFFLHSIHFFFNLIPSLDVMIACKHDTKFGQCNFSAIKHFF